MSKKGKKIGLMGGTFDPVHHGHMVLAEQVRTRFGLDEIIFIPSGIAPHKSLEKVTDKQLRYEMTLLATTNNPYFTVSDIEISRDEISYTINTIQRIKEQFGSEDEFYFITGADAIMELHLWHDFENLIGMCNFIAATRPGIDEEELKSKIDRMVKDYRANIFVTEVPALSISSTDIRRRVKYDLSIKYLLPEIVESYILKKKLYVNENKVL